MRRSTVLSLPLQLVFSSFIVQVLIRFFKSRGGQPADRCTMASFYGCFRQGTGSNLINPIMSAR